MTVCEKTDIFYPWLADIYYPLVEQSPYGNVDKQWILDATIACAFAPVGSKARAGVQPQDVNVKFSSTLLGRTRNDIRFSSKAAGNSLTNVIITNIRDGAGNPIYVESAGVRAGQPTLFEIATNEPIVGAFNSVEYYKLIIRRSDNQAETI